MRKAKCFDPSRLLYAVDLNSLIREEIGPDLYSYEIKAVWFRHRKGLVRAYVGHLWDISRNIHNTSDEQDAVVFIRKTLTDWLPALCETRWDTEKFWAHPELSKTEKKKNFVLLRSMIDTYPNVPERFDSWWSFR